jgi:hypothetical protein
MTLFSIHIGSLLHDLSDSHSLDYVVVTLYSEVLLHLEFYCASEAQAHEFVEEFTNSLREQTQSNLTHTLVVLPGIVGILEIKVAVSS